MGPQHLTQHLTLALLIPRTPCQQLVQRRGGQWQGGVAGWGDEVGRWQGAAGRGGGGGGGSNDGACTATIFIFIFIFMASGADPGVMAMVMVSANVVVAMAPGAPLSGLRRVLLLQPCYCLLLS